MSMKINDSIKQSADLTAAKLSDNVAKKTAKATNTAAASSSDSVTLSTLSSQLKSLEMKVAGAEVFDAGKVDAIKSAISSGQFKVNSDKVADSLIASVRDLLNTQQL
jgi:negative regulator of flagellin synthesis FlgM